VPAPLLPLRLRLLLLCVCVCCVLTLECVWEKNEMHNLCGSTQSVGQPSGTRRSSATNGFSPALE